MNTIIIEIPVEYLLNSTEDCVIHLHCSDGLGSPVVKYVVPAGVSSAQPPSFFTLMEEQIARHIQQEKVRTAETYKVALSRFSLFRSAQDLPLSEFTPELMGDYENWMHQQGLTNNTSSFYMRKLRSVYKKAVADGLVTDVNPFRLVFTGHAKTRKRAIEPQIISIIESADIDDARMAFARDMFMFSFYTIGMSFVDMAYLKKDSLKNGVLTYRRKKTGQELRIGWDDRMQKIVDRNPSSNDYLLPIVRRCNGKERNQYRHVQRWVNEQLHQLAETMRLPVQLTMYVARHSWASIARSLNIPIDVIRLGMGHNSARTTQIYLKEIDNGGIDRANRTVMECVAACDSSEKG